MPRSCEAAPCIPDRFQDPGKKPAEHAKSGFGRMERGKKVSKHFQAIYSTSLASQRILVPHSFPPAR